MLRIQAPAIITQSENIFTWYLPNFLLRGSLSSTCTPVHFKGLHQQQNGDKTERKISWLYCSKATSNFFHRPEHSIGILFHAKSKWKAQQKQIIHDFTRGDNNNYRSQNSSPFFCIPPSTCLRLIFKTIWFLAKYFCFGICKVSFLLLWWLIVGNAAAKGTTNLQTNTCKINLISSESFLFALEIFHLIELLCWAFCTAWLNRQITAAQNCSFTYPVPN